MITLTHVADTHLGHRQYGLKQREDDMMSTTRAVLQEAVEKHETDAILLPGDLFHSRDLRPKILNQIEQELSRVPDNIPVLVSRGNHDENLTPRDVTWLNYLHQRGRIVFLNADLRSDPETARFGTYNEPDPGHSAGFYDIQSESLPGPIRAFGLQWRGAKTDKALEQTARGIRETNDMHGEPAFSVLLAHFGIEDEVPSLGGSVSHSQLRDLNDIVDYLALGHIHKRYESDGWIFNPGSPEAHNTREGRDDWEHGYYIVDVGTESGTNGSDGRAGFVTEHHAAKRRPYYRLEFDVTEFDSSGELETAFRQAVQDEQGSLKDYCDRPEFMAQGTRREPMIDLRFTGTLQFSRGDFRTDELATYVQETCDALYVQVNTGIRTADVQDLISEIDEQEVFQDGQLNTAALEDRVFKTIAEESIYADRADDVADVLARTHQLAQAEESAAEIGDTISSARRDLFPDFADDVVIDVEETLFEADGHGATGSGTQSSSDDRTPSQEVSE